MHSINIFEGMVHAIKADHNVTLHKAGAMKQNYRNCETKQGYTKY